MPVVNDISVLLPVVLELIQELQNLFGKHNSAKLATLQAKVEALLPSDKKLIRFPLRRPPSR